ncbi:hypothetical protein [Deinococcus fonticola]|uniref:hypothetical protein n=1 Tax=Deinococcus fonticola TaxID=2528713 RepID=UPI001074C38B|nr:hypothetical protein [Deinococcus fonticola]
MKNIVYSFVLVSLTLSSSAAAQARSLPQILMDYVMNKPPADETLNPFPGALSREWNKPTKLKAQKAALAYQYSAGTDYWSFILMNPQVSRTEYMGTKNVVQVGQTENPVTNVYRVGDGRFAGFIIQEFGTAGNGMMIIHTPQMAKESPKLVGFVKP